MGMESVAEALEREHREIDFGIEIFASGLAAGESRPDALKRAIAALRRHIYVEERFLFPALREAGLVAPVFVMLREHGQIWSTLDVLELQATSGTADASTSRLLRELTVQLQHHNLKEEKILYPQTDQVLSESANADLTAFLESGQMPEGWVCERGRA
jgi:iron-sulfur cluster repair protein YtfE (RIC family)